MTELEKEVKRWSANKGTRQEICSLKRELREVSKFLSTEKAPAMFFEALKKYGRPAVAVSLACTLESRKARTGNYGCKWADGIISALQFEIKDCQFYAWDDKLHPLRIMEYAGNFIKLND